MAWSIPWRALWVCRFTKFLTVHWYRFSQSWVSACWKGWSGPGGVMLFLNRLIIFLMPLCWPPRVSTSLSVRRWWILAATRVMCVRKERPLDNLGPTRPSLLGLVVLPFRRRACFFRCCLFLHCFFLFCWHLILSWVLVRGPGFCWVPLLLLCGHHVGRLVNLPGLGDCRTRCYLMVCSSRWSGVVTEGGLVFHRWSCPCCFGAGDPMCLSVYTVCVQKVAALCAAMRSVC